MNALREVLPTIDRMRHRKVDCESSTPKSDDTTDTEEHHRNGVCPFRTLWTITERTNQDDKQNTNVELQATVFGKSPGRPNIRKNTSNLENDFKDSGTCSGTQEIESISAGCRCGRRDELTSELASRRRSNKWPCGTLTKKNER